MGYLSTARYGIGDITGQQGVAIGAIGRGLECGNCKRDREPGTHRRGARCLSSSSRCNRGCGHSGSGIRDSCHHEQRVWANLYRVDQLRESGQRGASAEHRGLLRFARTAAKVFANSGAIANFDMLWNWLQQPQQCGNPALGDAGKRCITDRQSGACTWHQAANTVPPWGTPPAGACWNWFNGYRDPIANDTNVYDDSSEVLQVINGTLTATPIVSSGAGASTSLIGGLPSWWPLAAAAVLIGVGVMR